MNEKIPEDWLTPVLCVIAIILCNVGAFSLLIGCGFISSACCFTLVLLLPYVIIHAIRFDNNVRRPFLRRMSGR